VLGRGRGLSRHKDTTITDPAVQAAAFALEAFGPGPTVTGEHLAAVVSYLQTQSLIGPMLAALTGRAFDVLTQEFAKAVH
jgi:hypothetical protein